MKFSDLEKLKKRLKRQPRTFAGGQALCRDAYTAIETMQSEEIMLVNIVDGLLAHCEKPECAECGKIVCPFKDPMHFHHDGCPSCAEHENPELPKPTSLIVLPNP